MATYSIALPSVNNTGAPIAITTGGTTVHTTSGIQEVFVFVYNVDTSNPVDVTVTVAGTSLGVQTIASKNGGYTILPGLRLTTGLVVSLTASANSRAVAIVNVNTIVP